MATTAEYLRKIKTFEQLLPYLEAELDWPLADYGFDELTFEYAPEELGLKVNAAAKVKTIRQLRPLRGGQPPWGIFFIEFERKRLPVAVLRRILNHLARKKRASANRADQVAFAAGDLLFISLFGEETSDQREIAFAHFYQAAGDSVTLQVLDWDGADTPLKLAAVAATLQHRLRWPDDPRDVEAWRETWRQAFRHRLGHVIKTTEALVETLARLARGIRDAALTLLQHESAQGPWQKLLKAFQTALIHDLTEEGFADTYAQTITYGLLTAAISRTEMSEGRHGTVLLAENVADIVPVTNPFLKEMLQTFLTVGGRRGGIDFDELGIQDVVELLRSDETDLPAVLRDFGNRTQGEDPVIHFYEHFLSAYNKKLKVQRGVFYTPRPVVSYIVRSVHELLRQPEFGLEDGLASTVTWGEMQQRQPDLKIPEGVKAESPFVQILDPATGTATFLVEVIEIIHQTLTEKWQKQGLNEQQRLAAWNMYVPKHLLPRLYGYELMMAPYAIAHMKIGLKLHETGYRFQSEERVRVYLTNALEPASDVQQGLEGIAPALAHEAQAVNKIKRHTRFTVVIGNPPYSNFGMLNKNPFILGLLEDYKRGLDEKKINLDDDFIKFVRFSQATLEHTGTGVLGFITNNVYLEGLTHRRMRQSLMEDFPTLRFVNLHGDQRKKETAPDGSRDENVFDIMQGVAVGLASRTPEQSDNRLLEYTDVWGLREEKYRQLAGSKVSFTEVQARGPNFFFKCAGANEADAEREYLAWWRIADISEGISGIETKRDHFAIDLDRSVLQKRIRDFVDGNYSDAERKITFDLRDNEWVVAVAVKQLRKDRSWEKRFVPCLYRPFDPVWIIYHGVILARDRGELMAGLTKQNLGLIAARQSKEPFAVLATNCVCTHKIVTVYDRSFLFPLYRYPTETSYGTRLAGFNERAVNLSSRFIESLTDTVRLKWTSDGTGDLNRTVGPEDIFHYTYAVFHSPGYRTRYAEFLKIDFPRLPLTSSLDLFRALSELGGELVALHLMESPKLDQHLTTYTGLAAPVVEKVSWADDTVWIDKAQKSGFRGVPEDVWNFHIGGYRVCNQWLKDRKGRKGRTLTAADINHYHRIVVALSETIRLMAKIDEVIDRHGGWPGAFATNTQETS